MAIKKEEGAEQPEDLKAKAKKDQSEDGTTKKVAAKKTTTKKSTAKPTAKKTEPVADDDDSLKVKPVKKKRHQKWLKLKLKRRLKKLHQFLKNPESSLLMMMMIFR